MQPLAPAGVGQLPAAKVPRTVGPALHRDGLANANDQARAARLLDPESPERLFLKLDSNQGLVRSLKPSTLKLNVEQNFSVYLHYSHGDEGMYFILMKNMGGTSL